MDESAEPNHSKHPEYLFVANNNKERGNSFHNIFDHD
jgi:hypothetical protein